MSEQLKPCPMCGSTQVTAWHGFVQCHECHTNISGDTQGAIAAWNNRHEEPAQPDIKAMVDRFLTWRLPEDFAPDCGISFDRKAMHINDHYRMWPTGTNLLTAEQARQMLEYVTGHGSAVEVKQPNRAPGNVPELCDECGGNIADDQCQCGEAK